MEELEAILNYEYDKLDNYAQALLNVFWDERKATIEDPDTKHETALLGCRFKGRRHNLRVVWFYNRIYGPKGNKSVLSTEISKPRNKHNYLTSDFRKAGAPKWEVELATEIEKELSKIRARKAELDELSRSVKKYQKNIGEMDI